jgi:electron transport complex protein RnfG
MKDIPKYAFILFLVTSIASGTLSWVDAITKPKRIAQQEKELQNGLFSVIPKSNEGCIVHVELENGIQYYKGYGNNDTTQFIGYAFPVISKGYQSDILTLVGIDSLGTILSIKILSQLETPGLGSRCEEIHKGETLPWWQSQFTGKNSTTLSVDKDGGSIESITGATITSRAITDSIGDRALCLLNHINENSTLSNSLLK